jgi:hypothetical protein
MVLCLQQPAGLLLQTRVAAQDGGASAMRGQGGGQGQLGQHCGGGG